MIDVEVVVAAPVVVPGEKVVVCVAVVELPPQAPEIAAAAAVPASARTRNAISMILCFIVPP